MPRLDPQDPLPESRWLYRRILVFGFATLLAIVVLWVTLLIAKMAFRVPEATPEAVRQLTTIVCWLIGLNALLMILYLIAPSGEQIAKMAAAVASLKHGGFQTSNPDPEPGGQDDAGDQDLSADMEKKQ